MQVAQRCVPRVVDLSVDEFRQPGVADAGLCGDSFPVAAAQRELLPHLIVESAFFAHGATIAKDCLIFKQHIAMRSDEHLSMERKPINDVLAENLAYFMRERGLSQAALAKTADMGQTTVSLYLNPGNRQPGKSGKAPSAKLAEVQRLAGALGVEVWELLRPATVAQRDLYRSIEALLNERLQAQHQGAALSKPHRHAA